MALRWDVTKVENYEANFPSRMVIDEPIPMKDQDGNIVRYVGEKKEREVWNEVTEALALAGMFHGIREITKDNVDEIYTRIRMFEISGLLFIFCALFAVIHSIIQYSKSVNMKPILDPV